MTAHTPTFVERIDMEHNLDRPPCPPAVVSVPASLVPAVLRALDTEIICTNRKLLSDASEFVTRQARDLRRARECIAQQMGPV